MLHQYRIKLNSGATAVIDGRSAIPVSILMTAGTVTMAPGIDKAGPWSPAVAVTQTAGTITTITPAVAVAPWYQVTTTGGGGTLIMQERRSGPDWAEGEMD